MERLQTEVTRYKTLQLKAMKDAEKYKEERDTVLNEYRLVMSERDQVHKEIDKLQTELELAQGHLKNTSSERKVAGEELEALRQVRPNSAFYCFSSILALWNPLSLISPFSHCLQIIHTTFSENCIMNFKRGHEVLIGLGPRWCHYCQLIYYH